MLEKRLQTLEQEKQEAIDKVRAVCTDEKTVDLAIKEIEANCVTIENWLTQMHEAGHEVNEDLSEIGKYYEGIEDYRRCYNHVSNHLLRMRNVPIQVEKGKFEPYFATYY